MKYQIGSMGRVFLVKLENEEDVIQEIQKLAVKENISSAVMLFIGALQKGDLVQGPRDCTIPPYGIPFHFEDGRELIAAGTLFKDETEQPVIHLHGSAGRENSVVTGCFRQNVKVYLMVEAVILELQGIDAKRKLDPVLQVKTLFFENEEC